MTDHEETAKRLTRKWNGNGYELLEQMIAAALAQAEAEGETGESDHLDACVKLRDALGDNPNPGLIGSPTEVVLEAVAEIARLKAENLRLSHEGLLVEKQAAEAERDYFQAKLAEAERKQNAAEATGVRAGLERARMILASRVFADGEKCCNCDVEMRDRLDAEIAKAGKEK